MDKICRKFVQNSSNYSGNTNPLQLDSDAFEKRCKKVHEYKLALAIDESVKELSPGVLRSVLEDCGKQIIKFTSSEKFLINKLNFCFIQFFFISSIT